MARAKARGAEALILDLEDAVGARADRGRARHGARVPESRPAHRKRQQLWVRINPLRHATALPDLAGVVAAAPTASCCRRPSRRRRTLLDHYLDGARAARGHRGRERSRSSRSRPKRRAPSALDSYRGCSARLLGLTWGAEDLSAALGASTNRLPDGAYEFTYQLARSLCLFGARPPAWMPIDTIWGDFRDTKGLREDSEAARAPASPARSRSIPTRSRSSTRRSARAPSDVAHAERVVAAFARSRHGDGRPRRQDARYAALETGAACAGNGQGHRRASQGLRTWISA